MFTDGIDDERETMTQKVSRLLTQAVDMEASMDYRKCEKLHLERIQIVSNATHADDTNDLSYRNISRAHSFSDYGEFCLRQASTFLLNKNNEYCEESKQYWAKGREALNTAFQLNCQNSIKEELPPNTVTLHVCCVIESHFGGHVTESGINRVIEDLFYEKIIFPRLGIEGSLMS